MSVLAWLLASRPALVSAGEEAARRRPRVTGLGVLCCLAVVLVVLLVVIVASNRRRRGNGDDRNR